MSVWEEAKKNLVEWYEVTADKTSEMAKVTSRRYDKYGLSRDIERQFSELGSVVYVGLEAGREDILASEEVRILVERVKELETDLRRKESEIDEIKREHAERKAAAAAAGGASGPDVSVDPSSPEGPEPTDPVPDEPVDADAEEIVAEAAGDADELDPKLGA